jgi:hypothetical protein
MIPVRELDDNANEVIVCTLYARTASRQLDVSSVDRLPRYLYSRIELHRQTTRRRI